MTDALSQAAETALAQFRHHHALASTHSQKADKYLTDFLAAITTKVSVATLPRSGPRCVTVWTEWLAANGPNTRTHITDETGVKFTERGTPYTVRWQDVQEETELPQNTIVRFIGQKPPSGKGAPPTIYALWYQRYDVYPLFGVGPQKDGAIPPTPEAPKAMTGVIRPPDSPDPDQSSGPPEETPEQWAARVVAMRETEQADDGT